MKSSSVLSYIILTIATLYAFGYPMFKQVSVLIQEKSIIEEQINQIEGIEERKNALLAKFNTISSADVKMIETLIPSEENYVKLAADIDATASKYGISIKSISASQNASAPNSVAEATEGSPYNSSVITVAFEASYQTFSQFLLDLERSLRILDIASLRIMPKDSGVYAFDVDFRVYWSNSSNPNITNEI